MGKELNVDERYEEQLLSVYKGNWHYTGEAGLTRAEIFDSFQGYLLRDASEGNDRVNLLGRELQSIKKHGNLTAEDYMRTNLHGLPMLLGRDEEGNPYKVDFDAQTSGVVVGGSGSGKSYFAKLMMVNLLMTNGYTDKQFIILDVKSSPLWQEVSRFPHVLGYHTEYENYLGVLREVYKEITRRKELLMKAGYESIADARKSLREEDNTEELKRYSKLTIVIDEITTTMERLKSLYEEDKGLYEELRSILSKIVQEGRMTDINLLVVGQRAVDASVPKTLMRNSTLKAMFRTESVTECEYMFGRDYSSDGKLPEFAGEMLSRNMNDNKVSMYKTFALTENHRQLKSMLRVMSLDWVRRGIGEDDPTEQPNGMDLGVAYNRDVQLTRSHEVILSGEIL